MHDLEITWSGGQIRFSPEDSPVLIGRSSSAAVVVPQGTVSRRHLIMTWNGRSWSAEDLSTHGTFDPIGVRLAATWTVGTDLVVRLGSPRGAELSMNLFTKTLDEQAAANPFADPESPPTVVDFGPPPRPDQGVEGSDLLHVADSSGQPDFADSFPGAGHSSDHSPDHRYNAEPEVPSFAEPVASAPAELDLRNETPASDQPGATAVLGADPPSFRPDPVAFEPPPETAVLGADAPNTQNTLVEADSGPTIGAAPVDQLVSEATADSSPHDPVVVQPMPGPISEGTPIDAGDPIVVGEHPFGAAENTGVDEYRMATANQIDGGNGSVAAMLSEPAVAAGAPAATFVENDTLRLQIDGEDYVFMPGHEVTVGRDPRCTVTVDERHSLVSRRHLRFVHAEGSWWLEDASSKGTYVAGRRLNRPYRSEGAFIAHLGDGAAGTQLRVVTSGQHRQPTDRAGLAIAAIAATALLIAAAVAWFVFGGGDDDAAALSTAKRSTVMLLSDSGHGSGFFVSDSLIITNQHVAAMSDQLVVAVSPQEDEPAEIQYVASLVENHPFLDIAVVQITNRAEFNDQGTVTIGEAISSADVPLLQLGDSSVVTIGDPVTSTGFPGRFSVSSSDENGQLRLAAVSTTSGQVANFTPWPGCSTPDLSSFIPEDAPPTVTCSADGNIDKGVLLASLPSGEGASGSAIIHGDKVVAVLFAGDTENATASRSIATNAFSDWLGQVLARNG